MCMSKRINKKTSEFFKKFEDEDFFGVAIDDCESGNTEKKEDIPPGDDGYGDDEEATVHKI